MIKKSIGYARTASDETDINAQVETLKAFGCSVVYMDRVVSGSSLEHPGLEKARADVAPGDTLKVVRLDRIGRSVSEVMTFVADLKRDGIALDVVGYTDTARRPLPE